MILTLLALLVGIVRVHHSPLGGPATPGTTSSWADGTEPVVSPRVHPNPNIRVADLVDRKPGIALSAAADELGLTLTALRPILARLEAEGRVVVRDGALVPAA